MNTEVSAAGTFDPAGIAEPAEAAEPQAVVSPLTGAAIFLVALVRRDAASEDTVRSLCADMSGLVKAVGFRDLDGHLTCVTGVGATAWDRLTGLPRPAGLHPFRELRADGRHAVSTPGDMLFHLRAARMDLCFELAAQITSRLAGAATIADEVHGFAYFDQRDLLGFVDGTENPTGAAAPRSALIGAEEPDYAGGSYVIVQKYLHNLDAWNAVPVETQELIIGRKKLSDIELDDSVKPSYAHNALNVIEIDGEEIDILRDNMPFGNVSTGEFGTYFIGYARSPATTEQMLENMFIGSPPGNYDRILDFSTAVTGTLFFVPSQTMLDDFDSLGAAAGSAESPEAANSGSGSDCGSDTAEPALAASASTQGPAIRSASDGSLKIGSLRGDTTR